MYIIGNQIYATTRDLNKLKKYAKTEQNHNSILFGGIPITKVPDYWDGFQVRKQPPVKKMVINHKVLYYQMLPHKKFRLMFKKPKSKIDLIVCDRSPSIKAALQPMLSPLLSPNIREAKLTDVIGHVLHKTMPPNNRTNFNFIHQAMSDNLPKFNLNFWNAI